MVEQAVNPPKYPRTLHWPWSQTVHKDDKYHQDPELFLGKEMVITEKLDGGNTCLWNGEVYARSTGEPSHHGWMAMVRKHHAWKTFATPRLSDSLKFYGEDMFGIHSIEYAALKEDETFRLFAVRDGDRFVSWEEIEEYADALNVRPVPTVFRGKFDRIEDITKFFETEISKESALGGEREGFVIRYADSFDAKDFGKCVSKYVRANHVQTDEHWTKNWQQCKLKTGDN